jgi:hypothetical protein
LGFDPYRKEWAMNPATTIGGAVALCVGSAIIGRLALTRDQAWRTITVRLPALLVLLATVVAAILTWLVYAVLCFIGGSFYGLSHWWWPQLFEVLEFDGSPLGPVITGRRP